MSTNTTKVGKSSGKFEKGHEKIGGRKKGTPNKKTTEFQNELGEFKTIAELKELFYSTDNDMLKFQICKTFMEFEYPKRKAVEIETNEIPMPIIKIEGIKI